MPIHGYTSYPRAAENAWQQYALHGHTCSIESNFSVNNWLHSPSPIVYERLHETPHHLGSWSVKRRLSCNQPQNFLWKIPAVCPSTIPTPPYRAIYPDKQRNDPLQGMRSNRVDQVSVFSRQIHRGEVAGNNKPVMSVLFPTKWHD